MICARLKIRRERLRLTTRERLTTRQRLTKKLSGPDVCYICSLPITNNHWQSKKNLLPVQLNKDLCRHSNCHAGSQTWLDSRKDSKYYKYF